MQDRDCDVDEGETDELPAWIIKAAEAKDKRKAEGLAQVAVAEQSDSFWQQDEAEEGEAPAEIEAALEAELHMCLPGQQDDDDAERSAEDPDHEHRAAKANT